ncbi:MAG: 16S rRNA (cytosine(1402)-N(4))-methyltransferase RsmH, partial [Planctomycetes bacterium]|nr:16S rRNA (cytosine(1402)-N(4))-methyltransferase RsmH [Planctomycetota bacterium]
IEFAKNNQQQFDNRLKIHHARFSDIPTLLNDGIIEKVDMLLADLGVSSPQIDNADRGFSYKNEGPIDMRFDPESENSALDLIEKLSIDELADAFWKYGEERFSKQIARDIKHAFLKKMLTSTQDMAKIIEISIKRASKGRIRDFGPPARRVFQALRIITNNELNELENLIKNIPNILKPGGRAAIISFHSLEDRIVKFGFKELGKSEAAQILTKKPLTASPKELHENIRAKSAKLRAIILLH